MQNNNSNSNSNSNNQSRTRLSKGSLYEVFRRKIWEARLPIQIILSEVELSKNLLTSQVISYQNVKSRPFFTLALRTSYFPLLLSQLRRHYDYIFTAMEQSLESITPWLEFNGRALSWHYPIGHLFDEFYSWSDETLQVPWTLTFHFTDYPSDTLLPSHGWFNEEGGGAIGSHFYSILKQADYIRHGSGKGVNNLTKSEQTQLWDGIWTHSYEKFWKINAKLLGGEDYPPTLPTTTTTTTSPWRGIPIRLYTFDSNANSIIGGGGSSRKIIQFPITIQEGCSTLKDVLQKLLPTRNVDDKETRVISHGISIPLNSSILWLALYFIYPDGFLHLILAK